MVKRIKKANREALKAITKAKEKSSQMLSLELGGGIDVTAFEALPDDTLDAIHAKRAAHALLETGIAASKARLAADIFVAAFVLPKTAEFESRVPTSQDLWLVLNGDTPRPGIAELARYAAHTTQAFHWWQAFPQVLVRGGFAVMLGNPPWERIKLQEEEFFATRSPLVATAKSKAERTKRIELLREGLLLHTLYPDVEAAEGLSPPNRAEIRLHQDFIAARRGAEASSLYAHDSGRYPLTGVGDVNTYALFAESLFRLTAPQGRAGFIVPTGIATDDSTKAYFGHISQTGHLASLFDFENGEAVFPAVHRSYKFSLMTLGAASNAEFVCFATQVEQLSDPRRRFTLSPDDFRLLNPNTLTCPVFRSTQDAELTRKLYRNNVVLKNKNNDDGSRGGWDVVLRTMFHKSADSHLFLLTEQARSKGNYLQLYEGDLGHQFNHRYAEFRDGKVQECAGSQLNAPTFAPGTEWSISRSDFEKKCDSMRLGDLSPCKTAFLGFRRVARSTDERTVIACIIPWSPMTYGWILTLNVDAKKMATLCGAYNSLVFDYLLRTSLSQPSIPQGTFEQVALPPWSRFTAADLAYIVPRVLELTHTAHDMQAWADDLLAAMPNADPRPPEQHGTPLPPFPWNPERRAQLRAELDAYYARLYGLTRDELRYILDPADVMGVDYPSETFRVLKNNELREFGEYRTQRLVLEAWDRLANLSSPTQSLDVTYSPHGMIRSAEEGALAGLVMAVVATRMEAVSLVAIQSAVAGLTTATHYLGSVDGPRFDTLRGSLGIADVVPLLSRILPIVQRLEAISVLVRSTQGEEQVFARGPETPPREVIARPEHTEAARLLWLAEERRSAMTVAQVGTAHDGPKATGTQ